MAQHIFVHTPDFRFILPNYTKKSLKLETAMIVQGKKKCKKFIAIIKEKFNVQKTTVEQIKRSPKKCLIHTKTKRFLLIARFCGVFPLQNILNDDINLLKTSTYSMAYMYSWFKCLGFAYIASFALQKVLLNLTKVDDFIGDFQDLVTPLIFYGTASVGTYQLIKLANEWPKILTFWSQAEEEEMYKGKLQSNHILATILISLGVVKCCVPLWLHGLNEKEGNFMNHIKWYVLVTHGYLLRETNYAVYKGIIVCFFSFTASLVWDFVDVFLFLISSSLQKQIKAFIDFQCKIRTPEDIQNRWKNFREDYFKLTSFLKYIESLIHKLIALSIISNSYMLCLRLLRSYEFFRSGNPNIFHIINQIFINMYILLRLTIAQMTVASVHEEWGKVVQPIFTCPQELFNKEAERLLQEIYADGHRGLTAFKLFMITRSTILTMSGFLLSYEIFLIYGSEANFRLNRNVTAE